MTSVPIPSLLVGTKSNAHAYWIGKDAVVKHHKEVPCRLLEPVPELSHGDPVSGNLIVQGDNQRLLGLPLRGDAKARIALACGPRMALEACNLHPRRHHMMCG